MEYITEIKINNLKEKLKIFSRMLIAALLIFSVNGCIDENTAPPKETSKKESDASSDKAESRTPGSEKKSDKKEGDASKEANRKPVQQLTDFTPEVDFNNRVDPIIGGVYEKDYAQYRATRCLSGSAEPGDGGSSGLETNAQVKYSDLESRFTYSTGIQLKEIGSSDTEFILNLKETGRTVTAAASAYNVFPAEVFVVDGNDILSPIARTAYENNGAFGLRRLCGSHYVSQLTRRSEIIVAVRLIFQTAKQKVSFKKKGSFSIEGPISISNAIEALREYKEGGLSVQFISLQRGGDSSKLPGVLRALNGDTLVNCHENGANCIKLMGDLNEALSNQVGAALTNGIGVISKVVTTPLRSLLPVLITKEAAASYLTVEQKENRDKLIKKHNELSGKLIDVETDLLTAKSASAHLRAAIAQLEETKRLIKANIDLLLDGIAICFEEVNRCTSDHVTDTVASLQDVPEAIVLHLISDTQIHFQSDHAYGQKTREIECRVPQGGQITTLGMNSAYHGYRLGYKFPNNTNGKHGRELFVTCVRNSSGGFDVYQGKDPNLYINYQKSAPDGYVITAVSSVVGKHGMTQLDINYAPWNSSTWQVGPHVFEKFYDRSEGSVKAPGGMHISGFTLRPYDRSAGFTTIEAAKF